MEQTDIFAFLKGLPVFAWVVIAILAIGVLFAIAKKLLKLAFILVVIGVVIYLVGRFMP